MKEILLTRELVALVDDEDFYNLNQYKWYASKSYNVFYACRAVYVNKKRIIIFMHKLIMNTPKNMECDHIFHNTLDNRKFIEINGVLKPNLRNCTHNQNQMNTTSKQNSSSKYLGVSISKDGYIRSCIRINSKFKSLGNYKTEEKAAHAYDRAASKYFKEFANLNFKEELQMSINT